MHITALSTCSWLDQHVSGLELGSSSLFFLAFPFSSLFRFDFSPNFKVVAPLYHKYLVTFLLLLVDLCCPVSCFPSRYSSLSITSFFSSSRGFYFLPSAFLLRIYSPSFLRSRSPLPTVSLLFSPSATKMFQFALSFSFFVRFPFRYLDFLLFFLGFPLVSLRFPCDLFDFPFPGSSFSFFFDLLSYFLRISVYLASRSV